MHRQAVLSAISQNHSKMKMSSKLPIVHELSGTEQAMLDKIFDYGEGRSSRDRLAHYGDKKYVLPRTLPSSREEYFNFEGRSDDIWLLSVPRSGTTWTLEMLWLLKNDLNFEEALRTSAKLRVPFFE